MTTRFDLVKHYLFDMGLPITVENRAEELVVVDDEENGIKNLVIDCEDQILILEQVIMAVPADDRALFKKLLQWNRELVHGAFTLDDAGNRVIFRDTLQLENLDRNELEASIQSLSLAMAEYSSELLKFAKA
ncbi:MAG: YbjN domain-containing protein [Pseudomonadota bacterium]